MVESGMLNVVESPKTICMKSFTSAPRESDKFLIILKTVLIQKLFGNWSYFLVKPGYKFIYEKIKFIHLSRSCIIKCKDNLCD